MESLVCLDYETNGLDFFREDFRVLSAAFTRRLPDGTLSSDYIEGETAIREYLLALGDTPIVVHNLSFEYGVTKYRFPEVKLNFVLDTMRLVQVYDNGGQETEVKTERTIQEIAAGTVKMTKTVGLGLGNSIKRLLPTQYHNHKEPYYDYIRKTFNVKKGKEGEYIKDLPSEMLRNYNVADTETTLILCENLLARFKASNYDYRLDHSLYLASAKLMADSKGRGIKVDREALRANIARSTADIEAIDAAFRAQFAEQIRAVEEDNLRALVLSKKTEKGQGSAWGRALDTGSYRFKLRSGKQKTALFVDKLGMKPQHLTKGGQPAFGKAFLKQWGEGGRLLERLGTVSIELAQMENLLALSSYDGRWHCDLRAASTRTGRAAGGRGE